MKVSDFYDLLERKGLSEYLMPEWEENEVFFLRDGGVGIAFECMPLWYVNQGVENALKLFLEDLPPSASAQFIFTSTPDYLNMIDYYLSNKRSGLINLRGVHADLLWTAVQSYAQFLERKGYESITRSFTSYLNRKRLVITAKYGGKEREKPLFSTLFSIFRNGKEPEEKTLEYKLTLITQLKTKLMGHLAGVGFNPRPMKAQDLYEYMSKLINFNADWRDIGEYDGTIPLRRAVVRNDNVLRVHDDCIELGGMFIRSFSVRNYPKEWGLFDAVGYVGSEIAGSSLDFPYMICLNVVRFSDKVLGKIKSSALMVLSQRVSYNLVPRLKFKHEDLSVAMERIERGEGVYGVDLLVFIWAKTKEELELKSSKIISHFKNLGFDIERNAYVVLADFMSAMPFGFDQKMADFLSKQRIRGMFANNVATFVPFFGGWRGTRPEVFFIDTLGELEGFDFFSNPAGGYNSFVVGMTGSGKSVALQYIAFNYLAGGNRVWIIDIGRSYQAFAEVLGGDFIEFSFDNPKCVNPFSIIQNTQELDEYLEFLINLYYMMGANKEIRKSEENEKLIRTYLEEAIRESYLRYGPESCVDTLIEYLKKYSTDSRVNDFIIQLTPYSSRGIYGVFFNGWSNFEFNNSLTVFENDTLENIPDLRDPLIMLLTFFISKDIYNQHTSNYKHLVIIDEAHKFLGNPKIDLFIEQAYRRFRKHGASIILGTQGFEDFLAGSGEVSRAGRVIIENSYWKLFGMISSTSRNAIRNSKRLSLTEYEWNLLESVHPLAGEYGEMLLISEAGAVKVRIVLDDFMKALFFTDPETRRRRYELVKQGYSWKEAIEILKKEKTQ